MKREVSFFRERRRDGAADVARFVADLGLGDDPPATIELARDADGHAALTPEQAAAVARWAIGEPTISDNDIVIAVLHDGASASSFVVADALSRYVLASAAERERWAPVVAAAAAWEADVTAGRDRNRSGGALLAAVRAAP